MLPYPRIRVGSYTNWPTAIDRDYDAWYHCVATMKFDAPRIYITEDEFNQILEETVRDNDTIEVELDNEDDSDVDESEGDSDSSDDSFMDSDTYD